MHTKTLEPYLALIGFLCETVTGKREGLPSSAQVDSEEIFFYRKWQYYEDNILQKFKHQKAQVVEFTSFPNHFDFVFLHMSQTHLSLSMILPVQFETYLVCNYKVDSLSLAFTFKLFLQIL